MLLYEEIKIILSFLSLHRIRNFILLKIGFYLSRLYRKKTFLWGYPMAISIEPTTACNLSCPACPSGLKEFTRPTGNLKPEVFHQIFNSLKNHLLHINFYFQGEPLINSKIFDYIKTSAENKIFTLISTNGHFLDKNTCQKIIQSKLHKIIISIDGMSQSIYEKYRVNGNLDKVFEGVQNLIAAKQENKSNTPIIVLQWIAFEHNLHELPKFITYCKQNKLHYQIKTAQVYNTEQLKKFIPKNPKYSRYIYSDNELKIKSKLHNHCWRMWASCVFTIDGSIVPCCFDKDAQYKIGNILTTSFKEIWKSEPYNHFRKKILTQRSDIDICNNCSEGTKVWV